MTREFERLFTARLAELTRDLRFYHAPTGSMRAPQVYMTMLPLHEGAWKEGEFFPYLCWCYTSGEIGLKPHPFRVLIDAGLRVDTSGGTLTEQIQRGTADSMSLVAALRGLSVDHVFGAYKLSLPFEFRVGDRGSNPDDNVEGQQPHPYYQVRFHLSFVPR